MDDLRNTSGPVRGPVVQAGTINGGVHLTGAPARPISQLPPAVPRFVGRADELALLSGLLTGDGATPVIAINGTAGIGKTTLAVTWARSVVDRFPDGQLYVDLRGFDPLGPVEPTAAVRGFLDAFAIPAEQVPTDLEAQAALYRSHVEGRRVLVLLDNARDAEQVRPLLPGSPTCAVLVTSRDHLSGLVAREQARRCVLAPLSIRESRELLSTYLGERRVSAEERAVDELAERCARLPIALAIAGTKAVDEPHLRVYEMVTELAELSTEDDASTDLRAIFGWSYHVLPPDAARLFRLLGLHPGADVPGEAAASLLGLPAAATRRLLHHLVRASLLEEWSRDRYRFHDLLREYAAERAAEEEPAGERRAAVRRLLDHYLHASFAGERQLHPHRASIRLDPPYPGTVVMSVEGITSAWSWFTAEHANLLAALDLADREGFAGHVWRLAWTAQSYLGRSGRWWDWEAVQRRALAAAEDPEVEVLALRGLGRMFTLSGRYDEAVEVLERALAIPLDLMHTHEAISLAYERRGSSIEAHAHARIAVSLATDDSGRRRTRALLQLGRTLVALDEVAEARTHLDRALELLADSDDRISMADAAECLGRVCLRTGDFAGALAHFEEALVGYREFGHRWSHAHTLTRVGEAWSGLGEDEKARRARRRAFRLFTLIGHPEAERWAVENAPRSPSPPTRTTAGLPAPSGGSRAVAGWEEAPRDGLPRD
ncbi:NB-ARC domain-containing protein [Saccharothrix sp. BKS2]|uniref:NB-ARC domain-containing protein n=1 Tax=Saccharothrix sp. BKS2 TaxID=3064400 RepID=UPI0039EC793B